MERHLRMLEKLGFRSTDLLLKTEIQARLPGQETALSIVNRTKYPPPPALTFVVHLLDMTTIMVLISF